MKKYIKYQIEAPVRFGARFSRIGTSLLFHRLRNVVSTFSSCSKSQFTPVNTLYSHAAPMVVSPI